MSVPTDYNLQYDDYCGTYERYNCNLPSVCPDAMSYSSNNRTFCRDVRVLEELETQNLVVVDEYIEIDEIRYVVGQISGRGSSFYTLVVDPTDPKSLARAAQKSKVTYTV